MTLDKYNILKVSKKIDPMDERILKDPTYFMKQAKGDEKNENTYSEDFSISLKKTSKKKE